MCLSRSLPQARDAVLSSQVYIGSVGIVPIGLFLSNLANRICLLRRAKSTDQTGPFGGICKTYAKLIRKLHQKTFELVGFRAALSNDYLCSHLVNAVALYWGQQQGGATG